MRPRASTEKGPLHDMERLGTQAPPAVKKVHACRHNRSEGREQPPANHKEKIQMSQNSTAEQIQPAAPETPAPAAPAPTVLVEVDPKGTTARDLNLVVTVKSEEKPKKTKKEKVVDAVELGLIIVVAAAVYEGGKYLAKSGISYVFGGGSSDAVQG